MFKAFHGKSKNLNNICPLCHTADTQLFCEHKTGEYRQCCKCSLVFVQPDMRLDAKAEKERYDLHTNSPKDPHYRKFLSKVFQPVTERVSQGSSGLDFGSGPGPTLSKMFEEEGYPMSIYDHFYAKDEEVLTFQYDFITSTEVIEHLYDPMSVLDKLWSLLKEEGILVLLTQPYPEHDEFDTWYYKNDPTHVCFFSHETMQWLEKKWDADLEIIGKDVFVFKRRKHGN